MSSDFDSLGLAPDLLAVVQELGYETPTPIQSQSIPALLAGRDLLGQSKTGSGKTAAFTLPILQKLGTQSAAPGEAPSLQALIVCPTRELSAQVAREVRRLGRKHVGLVVLTTTGGEPFARQQGALERGVHIVVGTPGRLLDHLKRRTLKPHRITTVVLDEADRMLDMGFGPDVERILRALPKERQTVLFSATFPDTIESISGAHQHEPLQVTIDQGDQPEEILQSAVLSESDEKLKALYWVLAEHAHESVLIFCNFKATVAELALALDRDGASVDCFHGDLDQFERDQVLARFRARSVRILIATDVAGRGIDVEDLDLVVNYQLPSQPEVYVHRVGRTGRAGKTGVAVSLFTSRERQKIRDIEDTMGRSIERLKGPTDESRRSLSKRFARPAPMSSILISGGRKDKVRPGDILGALTGDAGGLKGTDVGKIEIQDRLSYVAVASDVSRAAIAALNKGRIKGKRFRASLAGER